MSPVSPRRRLRSAPLLLGALLAGHGPARAATPAPALVVVIAVDQFRADYLRRFRPWLSPDGFGLRLDRGAYFSDCHYLCVSFSVNDTIGHAYGPDSHEVMDLTLRTDRLLAELLKFLDARLGLKNCLVVLTADHGIPPVPERLKALDPRFDAGRIDHTRVLQTGEAALIAAQKIALAATQSAREGRVVAV